MTALAIVVRILLFTFPFVVVGLAVHCLVEQVLRLEILGDEDRLQQVVRVRWVHDLRLQDAGPDLAFRRALVRGDLDVVIHLFARKLLIEVYRVVVVQITLVFCVADYRVRLAVPLLLDLVLLLVDFLLQVGHPTLERQVLLLRNREVSFQLMAVRSYIVVGLLPLVAAGLCLENLLCFESTCQLVSGRQVLIVPFR